MDTLGWYGIAAALPFLALVIVGRRYMRWLRARQTALREGSQVVDTNVGPVEYAWGGSTSGPVLLVSHGTPGGYDQGLGLGALVGPGCRVLACSRPGYLRTPVEIGRTPQEQARMFAALLDALGVESAIAVGLSGGVPAALELAARYPTRTRALVAISGVTQPWEPSGQALLDWIVSSNFGSWLFTRAPQLVPYAMERDPDIRNEVIRRFRENASSNVIFESVAPGRPRRDGSRADDEELRRFEVDFTRVTARTLIVHGVEDDVVPFAQARAAADGIPNATLVAVERAGHLAVFTQLDRIAAWVEETAKSEPQQVDERVPSADPAGGAAGFAVREPTKC